jgi:hypothetical protein
LDARATWIWTASGPISGRAILLLIAVIEKKPRVNKHHLYVEIRRGFIASLKVILPIAKPLWPGEGDGQTP